MKEVCYSIKNLVRFTIVSGPNLCVLTYSLMLHQSMVGGITQLVECLLCTQEVIGSTPVTSSIFSAVQKSLHIFPFARYP